MSGAGGAKVNQLLFTLDRRLCTHLVLVHGSEHKSKQHGRDGGPGADEWRVKRRGGAGITEALELAVVAPAE